MGKIDTIEGTVNEILWYHCDLANDVLYLRLAAHHDTPTYAEETKDGFLVFRAEQGDHVVGMTVINWWKRFGCGEFPDSLRNIEQVIEQVIEPWARRLAA